MKFLNPTFGTVQVCQILWWHTAGDTYTGKKTFYNWLKYMWQFITFYGKKYYCTHFMILEVVHVKVEFKLIFFLFLIPAPSRIIMLPQQQQGGLWVIRDPSLSSCHRT